MQTPSGADGVWTEAGGPVESAEPARTVRGLLERVTYCNEENGYSVYRIATEDSPDLITAVGCTAGHMAGEELELVGEWTTHPKFGRQFQFHTCRSLMPSTAEGIKRYLSSGLVKGVGPKMAERIVAAFGEQALDVLDENPDALLAVRGINEKLLDSIKQSWEAQKEVRAVMYFLQSNGVSPNFAAKIFAAYGADTIQTVRENPYRLASDIFGIGFLTADKVALTMGIERDSPLRVEAGVRYAMSELTGEGHVYAPRGVLAQKSAELLGVDEATADLAILAAVQNSALAMERISPDGAGEPLDAVYLPAYYAAERRSASLLADLMRTDMLTDLLAQAGAVDARDAERWVREVMKIELAQNQLRALELALDAKTMIITGGPGTGKTTLIRAVIGIWGERGLRVQLAAPTGRAAKRMSEATGHEAKTIHRMLEYNGRTAVFERNPDNPLACDLLVVDEASMIDTLLFYHLLRATPEDCRLVLVGDVHQLPSVGPGNVLSDLIASGAIPVAELNEIFRQAATSGIIVNAHRVNGGELPEERPGAGLKDFYIVEQPEPERCVEIILKMVGERIKTVFGLDPLEDVQVLTPMHRGTLGASHLNAVLQKTLNPGDRPRIERLGRTFKVGDKVMQIRNDYEKEVYNGDIGYIRRADPDAGLMWVDMDGREIVYETTELDALIHAYAVSIHKSQGSEYPAVIIPVHTQHYVLLQRNLLYTGITRGKELVVLVGTKKALDIAVKNDDTKRRYTYLGERLRWAVGG